MLSKKAERLSDDRQDLSLLPARLALGASMTYHGLGKLRAEGPSKTGEFFESLGLSPGKFWAVAAGGTELFAGLSALLGVGTRLAAVAVLVTQGVALAKVHAKNGYDITSGGFEYNLALMGIAAGFLLSRPRTASVHSLLHRLVQGGRTQRLWRRARPSFALKLVRALG